MEVNAPDIAATKLGDSEVAKDEDRGGNKCYTYLIRSNSATPVHVRIRRTRSSLSALASLTALLNLSYNIGTASKNAERTMFVTAMKIAKPESPEGPMCHFAWKEATEAKQHIAMKVKKI